MTVHLWRIAADTPDYVADDMAGKGAAHGGGRWNHAGEHVAYASTSIALAAWQTRAHLGKGIGLPWNRYLVRIAVPDGVWALRQIQPQPLPAGWDAIPEGYVSRSIGSSWLASASSALLLVPSVIVEEEDNVLINPTHVDSALLLASKIRKFAYDPRV